MGQNLGGQSESVLVFSEMAYKIATNSKSCKDNFKRSRASLALD